MTRVIDAHVHVWDLDTRPQPWIDPESMSAINRTFSIVDLEHSMESAGVTSSVLVQVLNREDETTEFLHACAASDYIMSVVGWLDLTRNDLEEALQSRDPLLAGVRHQALAEADPVAWFLKPDVHRGLALLGRYNMTYDVMVHWFQLPDIRAAFDDVPELDVVIDHAGKPPVAEGPDGPHFGSWAAALRAAAERPRTWCKLSGLTTMANPQWRMQDLDPFIEVVVEAFGPDRVIFGSDWPVSSRRGSYGELVAGMRSWLSQLAPHERSAILGGNAEHLYSVHQG